MAKHNKHAKRPHPAARYAYGSQTFPVPAQVAGEELRKIEERDGGIIPKVVVDDSRPEDAPLHPAFEWDDEISAELYRQDQARQMIRSVRVIVSQDGERSKNIAFVSVTRQEDDAVARHYVSTARAMNDEEMRSEVLADALAQLQGWRRRYAHLAELAGVVAAIDAHAEPLTVR